MSEFIKVKKGNEIIEVHPDALADHQRLGWQVVVEEEPVPAETPNVAIPAPLTEEKAPKGKRK